MTRSASAAAPLTMALALTGTIASECLRSRADDASPTFPPAPAEASFQPGRSLAGVPAHQDYMEAQVTGMLARPLFSSTRRLMHEVSPEIVRREPTPPWRLAGVLVSQAGRRAIFVPTMGDKPVAVGEGERVGTFVVGVITAGKVTMLGPDGRGRVVHPAPDPVARVAAIVTSTEPASAALPARPPILDLLHSIPGEGVATSGPSGAPRDGTQSRAVPLGIAR